jgi:hypothetical protein
VCSVDNPPGLPERRALSRSEPSRQNQVDKGDSGKTPTAPCRVARLASSPSQRDVATRPCLRAPSGDLRSSMKTCEAPWLEIVNPPNDATPGAACRDRSRGTFTARLRLIAHGEGNSFKLRSERSPGRCAAYDTGGACLPSLDHHSGPWASRGADSRFLGAAGDFRGSKCLDPGAVPLE